MKTASVVLAAEPSTADLAALLERIPGGYWNRNSAPPEGGIDNPEGCVYVSYDGEFGSYWRDVLDPSEQARVIAGLGRDPRLAIHLHLSSSGDSERVARSVADKIIAAWGGVVLA